ncbi:T9SS type A sorting domain-containing protein [Flexithrix dorotheae]|uniref:T9SS type A sorting domain-containing protein n=1 Tax=Flexithrix dorotheae TaxID=70993 RepID=UPI000A02876B|nr:T9SS type A sorting domain-containing protein [Flexithrix dorotheae]
MRTNFIILKIFIFLFFSFRFLDTFSQSLVEEFKPIIRGNPIIGNMEVQPDGKIYLLGYDLWFVDQKPVNGLIRLNNDFSLDTTFNFPYPIKDRTFDYDIVVVDDSTLLFRDNNRVLMLNNDGSINEDFNLTYDIRNISSCGTAFNKILMVGYLYGGKRIIMVNRDGSVDSSFFLNFVEGGWKAQFRETVDDKILVSGIYEINDKNVAGVVRLNSNGVADTDFQNYGTITGTVHEIESQEDGKVLMAGIFTQFNEIQSPGGLIRINRDGSRDSTFVLGSTPNVVSRGVFDIEVLKDGKIMLYGSNNESPDKNVLARLNADGSIDKSFPVAKFSQFSYQNFLNMEVQGEEVIVSGSFNEFNKLGITGLASLSVEGILNEKYVNLGGSPDITAVFTQKDRKVIVGGEMTDVNGEKVNKLVRLNPDGSLDREFNPKFDSLDISIGEINDIEVQEDGKILIGGSISWVDSNYQRNGGIIRLLKDGTFDSTFKFPSSTVKEILIMENGTIALAGNIGIDNQRGIFRLYPDGKRDYTFNSFGEILPSYKVNTAHLTDDGGIIVSGYDEQKKAGFALKLDHFGKRDSTFNIDFSIPDLQILASAEIGNQLIFGGDPFLSNVENQPLFITDLKGESLNDKDLGYTSNYGYTSPVCKSLVALSQNELLVGGRFNQFNAFERNSIARTRIDGNVNQHFGFGFNDIINKIHKIDSSTILVSGRFTEVDGVPYSGIAKINLENNPPQAISLIDSLFSEDGEAINLSLNDFIVTDYDDSFPEDFTLKILEGDNYTAEDSTILPNSNFSGTIVVPVVISDSKGESDTVHVKVEVSSFQVTGIDKFSGHQDQVAIFPNPAKDHFQVYINNDLTGKVEVQILDVTGKIISSDSFVKNKKQIQKNIQLGNWIKGMYIIKLKLNHYQSSVKLMID